MLHIKPSFVPIEQHHACRSCLTDLSIGVGATAIFQNHRIIDPIMPQVCFLPHFPVSKQSKRFETKNLQKILSPNYPNPSQHSMPCGIELKILTGSRDHGELVGHCLAANLVHPSGFWGQRNLVVNCTQNL